MVMCPCLTQSLWPLLEYTAWLSGVMCPPQRRNGVKRTPRRRAGPQEKLQCCYHKKSEWIWVERKSILTRVTHCLGTFMALDTLPWRVLSGYGEWR